jgi:hypothetical protein
VDGERRRAEEEADSKETSSEKVVHLLAEDLWMSSKPVSLSCVKSEMCEQFYWSDSGTNR